MPTLNTRLGNENNKRNRRAPDRREARGTTSVTAMSVLPVVASPREMFVKGENLRFSRKQHVRG